MKKILLLQNPDFLDSNVKEPTDYDNILIAWERQQGGNSGNKLFTTSMEKFLCKDDISYYYYRPDFSPEYINANFSCLVWPTANIFGYHYIKGLETYSAFFSKLRIPVYVIGAGIQCKNEAEIECLARDMQKVIQIFLDNIYHTGGELALRGYYTKRLLDMVMPNTAVVTGCPSIYQTGRELRIDKAKKDTIRTAVNGSVITINKTGLRKVLRWDKTEYIDQDEFISLLYGSVESLKKTKPAMLFWRYSALGLSLVSQNRVKLIYDIPVWIGYMRDNFDLSIGTRIHGNVASLLSGVPAAVVPCDIRVRELAEFYEIPIIEPCELKTFKTAKVIYDSLDYTRFNASFGDKFDTFARFMEERGISHDLNDMRKFDKEIEGKKWVLPDTNRENAEYIGSMLKSKASSRFFKLCVGAFYGHLKEARNKTTIDFTMLKK